MTIDSSTWQSLPPEQVKEIIEEFLSRTSDIAEAVEAKIEVLEYMLASVRLEAEWKDQRNILSILSKWHLEDSGLVHARDYLVLNELRTDDLVHYRYEVGELVASRTVLRPESEHGPDLPNELRLAGVLPFYGNAKAGDRVMVTIWDGVPFVEFSIMGDWQAHPRGPDFDDFIQRHKQ